MGGFGTACSGTAYPMPSVVAALGASCYLARATSCQTGRDSKAKVWPCLARPACNGCPHCGQGQLRPVRPLPPLPRATEPPLLRWAPRTPAPSRSGDVYGSRRIPLRALAPLTLPRSRTILSDQSNSQIRKGKLDHDRRPARCLTIAKAHRRRSSRPVQEILSPMPLHGG